jgi:NTP pyrophosphatase (non-canonical NTP hydrolase)
MTKSEKKIFEGVLELTERAHENAIEKKWWEPGPTFPEALMLVVSELSEALEYYREGMGFAEALNTTVSLNNEPISKPIGIPNEMADAVIRICDLCAGFGIPLEQAIIEKMSYNRTRPERHGGKKI